MTWILLLSAFACHAPSEPAGAEARYVSLSPGITDTVVAIGAADALVGRSDWCTAPEVQDLPALGSALTPSLEGIVAVHPTGILVSDEPGTALDGIAPVHQLPWLTLDQVASSTVALGALLHREAAAEALAGRLRELDVAPPEAAPKVLLVIGTGGPEGEIWYVKRNSLHGQVLHAAGYRNAVDRDVAGAPSLTAEGVIALHPDAIVLLEAAPMTAESSKAAAERWSALTPLQAVPVSVLSDPAVLAVGPAVANLPDRLRRQIASTLVQPR